MWSGGQYAAVHFDRRGRKTPVRCFSIVGDPSDKQSISVAIKKTGKFTTALNQIKTGQIVYVQGPFGDFLLPDRTDTPLVFFAGGIGITPFISMLLDLASMSESNPVTLYYSCRSEEYLVFADMLEKIAASKPNIKIEILVKNGALPMSKRIVYKNGEINPQLIEQIVDTQPANTDYYLCGPAGFMNSISRSLIHSGVYEDNVVIEAFGQRNLVSAQERFGVNKKIYMASALGLVLSFGLISSGGVVKALKSEIKEHESSESQTVNSDDSSQGTTSTNSSSSDYGDGTTGSSSYQSTPSTTYSSTSNSSSSQQSNSYNMPMSGVS
jgi:ferredoxin-NADP reductase